VVGDGDPGRRERNGYHHRGDPWNEERYSVEDYVARTLRRRARAGGVSGAGGGGARDL
jgi:DMSO/TMAO reductase YedYZ molybdopterin-dependent catalytic subunit